MANAQATPGIAAGAEQFRVDDSLSAWAQQIGEEIPYPSLQFDKRGGGTQDRSSLYWHLNPRGWAGLDTFSPRPAHIDESGCVVFLYVPGSKLIDLYIEAPDLDTGPTLVLGALTKAIQTLPDGVSMATEDRPLKRSHGGIDDRQLVEFGRFMRELRTGMVVPAQFSRPRK